MFSGIIETQTPVLDFKKQGEVFSLTVEKPQSFNDIQVGDSISNDGVCLTVDQFDEKNINFVVGIETLRVTSWSTRLKPGTSFVNLERSLKLGDRMHGHLVTGHVDGVATVSKVEKIDQVMNLELTLPKNLVPYIWPKGSVALNGVSLTVNSVKEDVASFHLIPETMKRTNLSKLKPGDLVNVEVDNIARGLVWRADRENA